MGKKKILILGGGVAGQLAVTHFQKQLDLSQVDVTLVNKHDYTYTTVKLHETAAGNRNDDSISMDIPSLTKNINFIKS